MFDEIRAQRAVRIFESLQHTKGKFYGEPFILLPWQRKIIYDVYGTLNEKGLRQYKYIYIEVPKKQGKSELAAAAAIYHLFGDGERNGEVYGCAADRAQASLVFDVAVDMIDQAPALRKRAKIRPSHKRITDTVTGSFYQVLSAEAYCLHPNVYLDLADGRRKLAGDIISGDIIIGWDGNSVVPGVVARAERQPPAPVYRIRTCRGRDITVTGEHLFLAMIPGRRSQDQTHMYEWKKAKDLKTGMRVMVGLGWPNTNVSGDTEEAWALGAWVGDGECGRFRFTSIDPEVVCRLRKFIESIGSTLESVYSTRQIEGGKLDQYPIEHQIKGAGKRTKSAGREWIRNTLGQEARSHTKLVPDVIWRGGPDVWSAFLAGYLDTDGCIPTLTPCVRWSSASHDLLVSCQILLSRLGINASISRNMLTVSGREQLVNLYDLLSPFMALTRKKQELFAWINRPYGFRYNAHASDRIVSIAIEEAIPTISVEVDGIDTHVTNGIITHNTKHGLNPSAVIFDELHAQPNRGLWDVMTFGAGDARTQPIWWIITTAGDDPDRVSIGWEQHEYAMSVLAGHNDPTWYPVIYSYQGDDIYNEANWYAANPSLDHTITIEAVREAAERAKNKPADERLFRWLRLNQWITTKLTSWLPLDLFDQTVGEWTRADQLGKACYLGLDLSSTTDLTALAVLFPPQDTQLDWRVFWHCWLPKNGIEERVKNDKIPYDKWAAHGYLTLTDGDVIDYTVIEKTILEIKKFYKVQEIPCDRAMAAMLIQRLEQKGLICVDVPQTYTGLTDPMNQLEILLKGQAGWEEPPEEPKSEGEPEETDVPVVPTAHLLRGRMTHEDNPVARWCFGNTSIAKNGQGYIKFVKEHKGKSVDRTKRIDLTAAWVNAIARARFWSGRIDISAEILSDDWGM